MAREEGRFSERYTLNLQQAIDDFKSTIGLDPVDPESYAEKGWAHYYLAEYQKEKTRKWVWLDDLWVDFSGLTPIYKGNYEKAASDCAIAIGLYPLDTYSGLSRMELFERMKTTKGDEWNKIKEAWNLKGSYASMYDCQGSADFKLGNYQKAIKSFSKYLKIHPKEASKYELRGECYFYSGDYGKAIQDFTNVIEFTSKENQIYSPVYIKRAEAYMGLNDSEKAIKDYNKVIQEPSKKHLYAPQAYMGRGGVHLKLSNLKQAISDFDKVIELYSGHYVAFYDRGLAYYQLGNQEKAIDDMEIAACMDFKEAQEFLKSKGLWGKTPEEILEICSRKIEEYRKKEGQGKTSEE